MKNYIELSKLKTFKDRFEYLKIGGKVGEDTFAWDRYLNQIFYRSKEWRNFRHEIIVRDEACDLGIIGRDIPGIILIHHIVPITKRDILDRSECLMDPNNVICVSLKTHNAIHYGSYDILLDEIVERKSGDTKLW